MTIGSGFLNAYGVAVDAGGNVFVGDTDTQQVTEIPYTQGRYGTPVSLGSGFSFPEGVRGDKYGRVYAVDRNNIWMFVP